MLRLLAALWIGLGAGGAAVASPLAHAFSSIDGGMLDPEAWRGKAVLVVNTASQCGFTDQYEGLQTLYDTYREAGLVVLAVPSDDFNQELESAAEVKEFCEMTFGLDLPMADITRVKGRKAHAFYAEVRAETGFVPRWNFNKVLVGRDGAVVGTWDQRTRPMSRKMVQAVEAELARQP